MAVFVSAKGRDITTWRAIGDFTNSFRQTLLDRSAECRSEEVEALFVQAKQAIDTIAAAHDACLVRLDRIISETSTLAEPDRLKELTVEFYGMLYEHFGQYRSAPAFFQFSGMFLHELTGALTRYAAQHPSLSGCRLPDMALVTLGQPGCQEYSPFCPLQLVMVHGQHGKAEIETVSRCCSILQEGFEACGLKIDGEIRPVNPFWRGTLTEWEQRLKQGLERGKQKDLIDLLRLADQETIYSATSLGDEFRKLALHQLQESHRATGDLVVRLLSLSNGLGIMGGWLLEKKGPNRGLFRLFDHALLPLSTAVTALALINRVDAVGTPQRIRELLARQALNVELAERLLQSWHTMNELRLLRERAAFPDWSGSSLYLDVTVLDDESREALRDALDTIIIAQRQVSVSYSGLESERS
jgi:hypothetical protein